MVYMGDVTEELIFEIKDEKHKYVSYKPVYYYNSINTSLIFI